MVVAVLVVVLVVVAGSFVAVGGGGAHRRVGGETTRISHAAHCVQNVLLKFRMQCYVNTTHGYATWSPHRRLSAGRDVNVKMSTKTQSLQRCKFAFEESL